MNAHLITDNTQEEVILTATLRQAGLHVSSSASLDQALALWMERAADVIVVTVRVAEPLAVVRAIRGVAIAPLILIVDRISEDLHVELVEAGADWVIERPYSVRLLIAYAGAMLRRGGTVQRASLPTLQYEQVKLNPRNRTVVVGDSLPQRLSQLEFRLLHTLMVHQGQVLPTETIVEHVWGYSGDGDRRLVRGLINRLRTKIEPNPNNPQYIRTVARVGYCFGDTT